jgi:uncharacterized protein YPO0396
VSAQDGGDPAELARTAAKSVEDHILALFAAANRQAGRDADEIVGEARQAARQVLIRINAVADRLDGLEDELRASLSRRAEGDPAPVDPDLEEQLAATPEIRADVARIAENLRLVLEEPREPPPQAATSGRRAHV